MVRSLVDLQSERILHANWEELISKQGACEVKLQMFIDLIGQEKEGAQKRVQVLEEQEEQDQTGGAEHTLAIQECQTRLKILEEDQVSSKAMLEQVRSALTQQNICNVWTSEDSTAYVGMPEFVVGKVNQRIWNVSTRQGSASIVGVFAGNVNMNDMLPRSR